MSDSFPQNSVEASASLPGDRIAPNHPRGPRGLWDAQRRWIRSRGEPAIEAAPELRLDLYGVYEGLRRLLTRKEEGSPR